VKTVMNFRACNDVNLRPWSYRKQWHQLSASTVVW